jgi:hypothetical protein
LAFPSSCLPYFWCLLHFSPPPFCSLFRNRPIPYPFLPQLHSSISLDRSPQPMPHSCCHLTIPASHYQSSSSLLPRQTHPVLLTSLRPPLSAAPLPLFTALYTAYCTIALNLYITSLHRIPYHYIAHRLNATELSAQYSSKLSAHLSSKLPTHSFFCPYDSTDPSTLAASLLSSPQIFSLYLLAVGFPFFLPPLLLVPAPLLFPSLLLSLPQPTDPAPLPPANSF